MWISKARLAFRFSACRRSSTFFELYGRAESTEVRGAIPASQPSCSTAPADEEWNRFQALLERFQTHTYIHPGQAPARLCRETLKGLERLLASSPRRRSTTVRSLWRDALALWSHLPTHDVTAAADTASALLLSDQAQLGCHVCSQAASHPEYSRGLCNETELSGCLRLLTVHAMCACYSGEGVSVRWWTLLADSLEEAKRVISGSDKSRRAPIAHAMEVLAWSLDWLHHHSDISVKKALCALKTKLPRWLPLLFEEFNVATAESSSQSLAFLPPRWLLAMATHAESDRDVATLERLLRHALTKEQRYHGYTVFQLSSRVADILVRCFPDHPSAGRAVTVLGTALHCSSLSAYGKTRDGFATTVGVLAWMSGVQPYVAMRTLLRHHSADTAAKTQEQHGDLLTGNPHLNWRTALSFTMQQVEAANPHWRVYLPETLRLLSDAGKSKQFWSFLQEYNASDATANISVAASLSHVMQRSGRWWHAMEVLDLLASAHPPRDTIEDQLMTMACTDTLHVLLQAKRWQEALRVFLLLRDAFPPTASSLVSRLLTSMPTLAPWDTALAAASQRRLACDTTQIILRCVHAGASAALLTHYHQQRLAVPIFAQHGRWDLVRTIVEQRPTEVIFWHALVQAIVNCADVVDEPTATTAFPVPLPQSCVRDMAFVSSFARLCLQRGWLSLLSLHLLSPPASSQDTTTTPMSRLRVEYEHLLRFIQSNCRPPPDFVFTDSYVVHQLMSCVTNRRISVVVKLASAVASTKRQASTHLRIPYENLSAPRPEGDGTFVVRASSIRAATCLKEHCIVGSSSDIVVGYKVPAASLFASASGLLRVLNNNGVYSLAYHMSLASSGLYLLYPAHGSLSWYAFRLRVHLCLAVLPKAPHVPLLATSFFDRFAMRWRRGQGNRHEVEAVLVAEGGQEVRHAWRSFKTDLNAEGWGPVELEGGAGDMYHIVELHISRRAPTNEGDAMVADVMVFSCRQRSLKPLTADDDAAAAEWDL
ncbi:hypothetical protein JKF63_07986 [Porcisia hertigi]|uniref:Uncharacterized protein n=1 Tax=Porcisia hertigi TaxID=2761500 RepID=A0A836IPF4_9TRYP|nr:hypothetical protein JKF63_07986 [Porcisia hertigi]